MAKDNQAGPAPGAPELPKTPTVGDVALAVGAILDSDPSDGPTCCAACARVRRFYQAHKAASAAGGKD